MAAQAEGQPGKLLVRRMAERRGASRRAVEAARKGRVVRRGSAEVVVAAERPVGEELEARQSSNRERMGVLQVMPRLR